MQSIFQKRIEKIVQAIYLASNHIKDSEPLKWELRKESLALLACGHSLDSDGPSDIPTDLTIEAITSCGYDVVSLLTLSSISGLVSSSNSLLIIHEIEALLISFNETYKDYATKAGFILSDDFFRTIDKGQNIRPTLQNRGNRMSKNQEITNGNKGELIQNIKDKKDTRQTQIIELLKSQSDLTIKDFAKVIVGCSEKTIQRELTDLVGKGIVRKDGERRWSKYSLNR